MKRYFQNLFLLSLFVSASNTLSAQTVNPQVQETLSVFDALQKAYTSVPSLSFNVRYVYTEETKPDVVLDSMKGIFQMSHGDYRFVLDSTETIHNEKYTIVLFKEDRMLYLTKSSDGLSTNPVQQIADFLKNNTGLSTSTSNTAQFKTLRITYPPGMAYKQIDLLIDTTTGFLAKAVYVVQTKLLMESDPTADPSANVEQHDPYARVEADFQQYSTDTIDMGLFDNDRFFVRDGKNFTPTATYKDYKIFLGSSNL